MNITTNLILTRFASVLLLAASSAPGQVSAPRVALSFSEGNGAVTTNAGSFGGNGSLVQATGFPTFSTNAPRGGFAPSDNLSAVDFGDILAGQGGRAMDLAGGTGGGQIGAMQAFTLAGWINCRNLTAGSGGNRILIAADAPNNPNHGFDLVQNANGSLQIGINGFPDGSPASSSAGRITANAAVANANWVFFAVTYDQTSVSFYFGTPAAPAALDRITSYARGAIASSGVLTVGNFNPVWSARNETGLSGSRVFRGLVDELRVFDRALSLSEIQAIQMAPPFQLVDPPPVVTQTVPGPGDTVRRLQQIEVLFSEPVQGVDAADLLINEGPATNVVAVAPDEYVFQFAAPATGTVALAWAPNHGIRDFGETNHPFVGSSWTYTFDPHAPRLTPLITEFMADNDNTLNDEDGDASDWIEIYNPDVEPANLEGYFLTDDTNWLTRWRLPEVVLPPKSYFVVFASEKNRTIPAAPLHTNFKLERNGEYLALLDPATNVVSEFAPRFPRQQEDVSYGRDRLSPDLVGFFGTPTPGMPNSTSGAGFAPEVVFSRLSGHFTSPFPLMLTTPVTNAVIRYLLVNDAASAANTNVPGANSPIYTSAMLITNSVQVRARAFVPGLLPGEPRSETFLALQTNLITRTSDLPILIVDTLGGADFNTTVYNPAHLSIYEPQLGRTTFDTAPAVTTRAALRVRGFTSANSPKKSWTVELRDEFNDDKDVSLLDMPAESDWVLYGPGAIEPVLIHNPFAYELARRLGQWAPRTRFVELYLNTGGGPVTTAHYHGIYLLMEKIKIADRRIEEARLEPEHTNAPAVTGTYLLQMDRVEAGETGMPVPPIATDTLPPPGSGHAITYTEPKESDLKLPQRAAQQFYIRNYMTNFIAALNSPNFADPVNGYARFVDIPRSIDQHLVKLVCFNVDAFVASSFFYKPRDGKLVFGPIWDFDRSLEASGDPRDDNPRVFRYVPGSWEPFDFFNDLWWGPMFRDTNFWQLYVDRYQQLRRTELSHASLVTLIDGHVAQVRESLPRESARWSSVYNPRTSYDWEVANLKNWLTNRLHFLDTNFLTMPVLNTPGGRVSAGFMLQIAGPVTPANTQVYYTLDGSDPRLAGGAISPSAILYTAPVTITNNAHVLARSRNLNHRNLTGGASNGNPPVSTPWSGPATAVLVVHDVPLAITEIMYHPADPPAGNTNDADNFEFIELKNVGSGPLSLVGARFTIGIDYTFTAASAVNTLDPGATVLLVKNLAAFQSRYPGITNVAGEYAGNLDNAGERLALIGPRSEPILDFAYGEDWNRITDGSGFSLVIVDDHAPPSSWGVSGSWRPSGSLHGSPGTDDPAPAALQPVLINEALTHTDPPLVDAIELHNPSPAASAPIGGWFLTDDFGTPKKFRIPDGTVIPAGGYFVFYETNSFGLGSAGFQLGSDGDELYLFSGDGNELTGYVHGFDFGAQFSGVSFGRHEISNGNDHFVAQIEPTLGAANTGPRVGPIVISEIMYRPPDFRVLGTAYDDALNEFVELRNITAEPVPLFDTAHATNTWRLQDGIEFEFPPDTIVPGNGVLLLVNFDPSVAASAAAFRAVYGLSSEIALSGPYSRKLNNDSDRLELVRPDQPDPGSSAGDVPYVLVERISYSDAAPWPMGADGFGLSLQRMNVAAYGNDPAHWSASRPTPGAPYPGGALPVITQHPQSQTVVGNTTAGLSVAAEGNGPFAYQWLRNRQPIADATHASIELTAIKPDEASEYQVLVFNAAGAVASLPATLRVLTPVGILQQPLPFAGKPGTNAVLSVSAVSLRPIRYQWRFNGQPISDATNNVLTLANVQPEHDGIYDVLVSDDISSELSTPVRLAILIDPIIVQQPASVTAAAGTDAAFSVAVTNTATVPAGYRWRRGGTYLVTNVPPARTDTFILSNVSFAVSASYSVVVTNQSKPSGNLSAAAYLTVVMPPTNQVVSPDGSARFSVVASNLAATRPQIAYQWQYEGADILGATNDLLVIPQVQAAHQGAYGVIVRTLLNSAIVTEGIFLARLTLALPDADGDGMPDAWEQRYALDDHSPADAVTDKDGDRMTNLAEYLAGTNPADPLNRLAIELVEAPANGATHARLRFEAVSNKTYSVRYLDALNPSAPWPILTNIPSGTTNRMADVLDAAPPHRSRFYRVMTP